MFVEKDLKHYEELLVAEQEKAQSKQLRPYHLNQQKIITSACYSSGACCPVCQGTTS